MLTLSIHHFILDMCSNKDFVNLRAEESGDLFPPAVSLFDVSPTNRPWQPPAPLVIVPPD